MLDKVKQNLERSKEEGNQKRQLAWTQYEKTVTEIDKKQRAKVQLQREELREYSKKVEATLKAKKDREQQLLDEMEERDRKLK